MKISILSMNCIFMLSTTIVIDITLLYSCSFHGREINLASIAFIFLLVLARAIQKDQVYLVDN